MENKTNLSQLLDNFLAIWKKETENYYLRLKAEVKGLERHEYRRRMAQLSISDQNLIIYGSNEMERVLNKEVKSKKTSFLNRIGKVGEIVESDLTIGKNGEINGILIGTVKTIKIDTIIAWGDIIKPHFRVLVKEIK